MSSIGLGACLKAKSALSDVVATRWRNTDMVARRLRASSALTSTIAGLMLIEPSSALADCTKAGGVAGDQSMTIVGASPVLQSIIGEAGCKGDAAKPFGSGNDGYLGQSAGTNTLSIINGAITSNGIFPAVSQLNNGGAGGDGSGDSVVGVNTTAGSGATGGSGGSISLELGLGTVLSAASTVVDVGAAGGAGGQGATGYNNGSGGSGGSGGQISIALDNGSSVTASGVNPAVAILSQGGDGGHQDGSARPADNHGHSAGTAGAASTITANLNGSVVASSGDGVEIGALGGNGGSAGDVKSGGGAYGTSGGGGGGGGTIAVFGSGSITSAGSALRLMAQGGTAGSGSYAGSGAQAIGGAGGDGGAGGSVTSTFAGKLSAGNNAIDAEANGGDAGDGGAAKGGATTSGGKGGKGGSGGTTNLTVGQTTSGGSIAVFATADGGKGGKGAYAGASESQAGNGGVGGNGTTTNIDLGAGATVSASGIGVQAAANGGAGGAGGAAFSTIYTTGGDGGNGGDGGSSTITLDAGSVVTTSSSTSASVSTALPGVFVQANGGVGGSGGSIKALIGESGGGGYGGNGGTATANLGGNITTLGSFAHGVLVQSISGVGGASNSVDSLEHSEGSDGGPGGDGGSVYVTSTSGLINTSGIGASAILTESIGGGGGAGGNATSDGGGTSSIGGNGGAGGNGGLATLNLGSTLVTRGSEAAAVVALNIGGSGGSGGNTAATGGEATVAIGGHGNNGGTGGQVNVTNNGLITTFATHSGGIQAQSNGGGGGDGGSGVSLSFGYILATSVSVGGDGGNGGEGGVVDVTNNSQVVTYGSDSYGLKAQTVGGGGGEGGSSMASANASAGGGDVRSVSLSASIGGRGGAGGSGASSPVTLTNNGFVATAGDGAIGLIAQNIAGGGGNGGDASASSFSTQTTSSYMTSVAVGGGGDGGNSGTGGLVTVNNNALVLTLGESAYGVLAQSIGGGGGQGSAGDAAALNNSGQLPGDSSLKAGLSVGGNGGKAGVGGQVIVDNAGGIATGGDGARGIMAQSIGGGGGIAGGGAGKANGTGVLTLIVNVGGDGGSNGDAGEVDVRNHRGIVTTGADAAGMFVQSVGGGGGVAGKVASALGGAQAASDMASKLQSTIANGLGIGQVASLVPTTTDIYQVGDGKLASVHDVTPLRSILSEAAGAGALRALECCDNDGITTGRLALTVTIGGTGGTGGNGGLANAYNEGAIATSGARSDGIVAQSIGGGGGAGGAVSFTDSNAGTFGVGVGGAGGAAGDGGIADLFNAAEAEVGTSGEAASALVAQSVGGGGGTGGATTSIASGGNLAVIVGGSGGSSGKGGTVNVDNDVSAYLTTSGKNAMAIIAQSVGGGGGIVYALSKDQTRVGGDTNSQTPDDYPVDFMFGDAGGSSGDGGNVTVSTPAAIPAAGFGKISTTGRNAFGILAQSVGGGGGLELGGALTGDTFFNSGRMSGNGGNVAVEVGGPLMTTGQGAVGVFAQSIGGGGGLGGDTGWTQQRQAFVENGTHSGDGNTVTITVDQGGSITTSAPNSPAIWAQSIGGGGGLVNTTTGPAYAGSAGGTGIGGSINIIVDGAVTVTGVASNGVLAQSLGDASSTSPITVTIGSTGNIQAGLNAVQAFDDGTSAGVYIDHGGLTSATPNVVTNNGTLFTYSAVRNSVAVWSTGGYTQVTNNGTMGGDILLQNGGGQGCFTNNGTFVAGDNVLVGTCGVSNFGKIDIKSTTTGTTTITGPYSGSGSIVFDADFAGGTSDKLLITGTAAVAGSVEIRASSVSNTKLALVTASGGLTLDPQLAATKGQLFGYKVETDGTSLFATPQARFAEQASGLGGTRRAVAGGLQALFDSGTRLDAGFTRLAALVTPDAYAQALDNLSGRALGGIGAYRYQASRNFVSNFNEGCRLQDQRDGRHICTWVRAQVNRTRQDENDDALGYRASAQTYELGAQVQIGTDLYLNAAAAYEHNRVRDNDRTARITGDSLLGGIGLRYLSGPLELSGVIDGGYGWYDSRRTITVGSASDLARARPRVWNLGAHLAAAYTVPLGRAWLRPFAEVRGVKVRAARYAERGNSPFNFDVGSDSDFAVSGSAGATLGASLPLGGGARLRPFVSGAVEFASDTDWVTTAHFTGQSQGDSFTTRTRSPGTFGRFAVGVDLISSGNLDFGISYTPEFGRDYSLQQGTARLTWRF